MLKKTLFVVTVILAAAAAFAGGADETGSEASVEPQAPQPIVESGSREIQGGSYLTYSPERFEEASQFKRVYFFHASWCPTCRSANREFEAQIDRIPADVVLFKTDYDDSDELKRRFGVTYQHTFVLVDESGESVSIWNGGDIARLIENTL